MANKENGEIIATCGPRQREYNLGGLNYVIGHDVGSPVTTSPLGSFDSKLSYSLGAA